MVLIQASTVVATMEVSVDGVDSEVAADADSVDSEVAADADLVA
jgi:hypothetical protein